MAPAGGVGENDDAAAMSYYVPMKATSEGAWQGDNPLHFSLPLVILQICLVVAVTRGLAFALRPLRQPRVIAEIIVSPSPSPLPLSFFTQSMSQLRS